VKPSPVAGRRTPRAKIRFNDRRPTTDHGFTLLEIIVALVVLGFVLAGLAQATRFGIAAWGLETRMADNAASLERMDRVLRRLIEQASPPIAADDKPFEGQEHRMVFLTLLPDQPQTRPIRHAQISIGIDDKHRLVLRWQVHPNAAPIGPEPPMHEVVLAEGLERIDLAYRQPASDGGKWSKAWADSGLPAVVQIHFVLAKGQHRWPDMQVPTMLDSNGSF
jgi:general secretion pathway protein J